MMGSPLRGAYCSRAVDHRETDMAYRLDTEPVRLTLQEFHPLLHLKAAWVFSNNATTVAYINRQGGTGRTKLESEAEMLLSWAETYLQAILAAYMASTENVTADYLSRVRLDPGRRQLNQAVFEQIVRRWGAPVMDLMATFASAKASRFYSQRERMSEGLDTLVQRWPRASLRLPSVNAHRTSFSESEGGPRGNHLDCPRLAEAPVGTQTSFS